jgi:hypothetical protein
MSDVAATPAAPAAATPAAEPSTFSVEYVRELRGEAKGWRLKAQELETQAKAAAEAAAKATTEAEGKVTAATKAADERIIRAELKAAAIAAGMVDLDGLKLADLSAVKLDESGNVTGANELMETLKTTKPYLFKAPVTSNTNPEGAAPKPGDQKPKAAKEMTAAEYEAAKRALVGR